jgi:hypothetical protein
LVDGRKVGTIGGDGTSLSNDVPAGHHSASIRKNGFRTVIADQSFNAGSTFTMDGGMQSAIGTLRLEIAPAGVAAHITIHHEGEEPRTIAENVVSLSEGQYSITAAAPGYQDASQTIRVVGGQTATAALVLKPVAAKVEKPRGMGLGDWEKVGGWEKDGAYLTRRGGGVVFAPSAADAGHYTFTVSVIKGKRVEWFVNYQDERNYVLFQLDDDHLTATSLTGGNKKTTKTPVHINREELVMVGMDVNDSAVNVSVGQQDKKFTQSVPIDHAAGKFAFRVPGKDQIELGDFHFIPR